MRRIDADKLGEVKFHSLPYTHITPSDVEAESYKRGWNDAIGSIIDNAPTIEPERKKGKWIKHIDDLFPAESTLECNVCHHEQPITIDDEFCPHCGADMREDAEEAKKCDTCQHEKEPWFNSCADCSDYELWESKE